MLSEAKNLRFSLRINFAKNLIVRLRAGAARNLSLTIVCRRNISQALKLRRNDKP
jgi:hypothetical protein